MSILYIMTSHEKCHRGACVEPHPGPTSKSPCTARSRSARGGDPGHWKLGCPMFRQTLLINICMYVYYIYMFSNI